MTAKIPPRLEVAGCEPGKGFFGKAILAPSWDMTHWIWLMAINEDGLRKTWEQLVPDRPFDPQYMIDAALMRAENMQLKGDL